MIFNLFRRENKPEEAVQLSTADSKEWSLSLIEKVVLTHSEELRRSRRRGTVFKALTFIYLFGFGYIFFFHDSSSPNQVPDKTGGHVALIQIQGKIGSNEAISLDSHRPPINAAFNHPDTKAIVLDINSPGGSPVQSQLLYKYIMGQRDESPDMPVYAVIGDAGASGGYYIASAADQILVSEASLVGGIGVISEGFGFDKAMDKVGIERRLVAAGENKGFLDPYSPQQPVEVEHWSGVLSDIHEQFKRDVQEGRRERINGREELFSGLVWSGRQAIELGLADRIGTKYTVASEYGALNFVGFMPKRDPFLQLLEALGISIGTGIGNTLGLKGLTIGEDKAVQLK